MTENNAARRVAACRTVSVKLSSQRSQNIWCAPPENPKLDASEVHVWRASVDQPASRIHSLRHLLAPDELERADRFHFRRDRDNFIAARGMLRVILGRYLSARPGQLEFRHSAYGKPSLALDSGGAEVRFNLSHSHNLVLYAFTLGREVGIDLEYMRRQEGMDGIAERFFSAQEISALRALPAGLRLEAFYNCWTRKEAYIKAMGEGLSFPLDHFAVSIGSREEVLLLDVFGCPQENTRWSLRQLKPGEGYAAAIAVEGSDWHLRCWEAAD